MKDKPKPKPRAYIKPEYRDTSRLPSANPFGVLTQVKLLDRNSIEYRRQTRAINDVLSSKKSSPIMKKITF